MARGHDKIRSANAMQGQGCTPAGVAGAAETTTQLRQK